MYAQRLATTLLAILLWGCGAVQSRPVGALGHGEMHPARVASSNTGEPSLPVSALGDHPRLFLRASQLPSLRALEKSGDALQRKAYADLFSNADAALKTEPVKYSGKVSASNEIFTSSRSIIQECALAALLSNNVETRRVYAQRAIKELLGASEFPSWFLSNTTDTSADTLRPAVAVRSILIGYDWLYSDMTQPQRKIIEDAIYRNFVTPVEKDIIHRKYQFAVSGNHGVFMGSGSLLAALVLADKTGTSNERLAKLFSFAVQNLKTVQLGDIGPSLAEGPSYLFWGMQAGVTSAAALKSATGSDYGIFSLPSLIELGDFANFITAPSGWNYTFGDSADHDKSFGGGFMLTLASQLNKPTYSDYFFKNAYDRAPTKRFSFASDILMFYDPKVGRKTFQENAREFPGAGIGIIRSDDGDSNHFYLAVKAGDNQRGHSHRDLGSFVLEMGGQRWSEDLGRDEYTNFPSNKDYRATAFRVRTRAHSTLLPSDQPDQAMEAKASIDGINNNSISMDLSNVYAELPSWHRVFSREGNRLSIRDTWKPKKETASTDITWRLLTKANVSISGNVATLSITGNPGSTPKVMTLSIKNKGVVFAQPMQPKITSMDSALPANLVELRATGSSRVGEIDVEFELQ